MKILCFDTETTGLPKSFKIKDCIDKDNWSTCRLLELGCILFEIDDHSKCTILEEYSSLTDYIMSDEEIERSGHIHNITNEMIEKDGRPIKEVLDKFTEMCNKANYILGHNISFDINVIINEMNDLTLLKKPKLCTCHYEYTIYNKYFIEISRPKYIKLVDLYKQLFDKDYEAHRALNDVKATIECFTSII